MVEYEYISNYYNKIKEIFPESFIKENSISEIISKADNYVSILLERKFTPFIFSKAFSNSSVKNSNKIVKAIIERIYDYAIIDIVTGKVSEKHRLLEDIIFLIIATHIRNKNVVQVWFAIWRIIVVEHTIAVDVKGSLHYTVPNSYYPIIFEKRKNIKDKLLKKTISNFIEFIEKDFQEYRKKNENNENKDKSVSKEILENISPTLFYIDFQYKFEHLLVALQLIRDPSLTNEKLAIITGKHRNTIRILKDDLTNNRLLRVAYRYSYRAINLETTIFIFNKLSINGKSNYFDKIIESNKGNPWLFRGYKTEKANFLFYLHPNDPKTIMAIERYKKYLEAEFGIEIEKMISKNEITLRNYNFCSYDPLYGKWSEKEAELEKYYQEKGLEKYSKEKQFHKFLLIHENKIIWQKPPKFKIKDIHFEIINHYSLHNVSKELTVRFMRKKLEKGQMNFIDAKEELLNHKVVIPYADLYARSFKDSLLTIKEIKNNEIKIHTPEELSKQPISWSSIYYKDKKKYLLSMTPLINRSVLKEAEFRGYYFYSLYLPKETLSSNWKIPTNKWDNQESKWNTEESEFLNEKIINSRINNFIQ